MNKTIIAIDPGAAGGIAVQIGNSKPFAYSMPTTEGDLLQLLREVSEQSDAEQWPAECWLENLVKHTGRNQPASTMAVYASNWGYIKGVIMGLRIPLRIVNPKDWQKPLGLGTARNCESKTAWKNKLKSEAQRRFPELKVTLATADALLILEHAKGQNE